MSHNQSWDDVADSSDDSADRGLEMCAPRARISPSTFGLSTRKPRRSPPSLPFGNTTENTTSSVTSTSSFSFSSSSSSTSFSSSHESYCSRRDHPVVGTGEATAIQSPHYDDAEPSWVEPLSPRPSRKRNSVGGSRAGVGSNTRTSFTTDGDRVEEFNGKGSLRIGTHWVDDETVEAPGAKRREWGRGEVVWR